MRHTISIAMTTFNGERFLREQLDSIYSQTLLPDEVVVCDDNSSDGTIGILEEYKQKYGLKYYINNPGLGVNDNFYKAMSLCTCDYIALSDQDDIWLPQKIELTYNKLVEIDGNFPVVVSSRCNVIDSDGKYIKKEHDTLDAYKCHDTLIGKMGSFQGCSLMMNRHLLHFVLDIKDKDERSKSVMYDAFISFIAAIIGIKYNLGNRLMLHRHHCNNVTAKIYVNNKSLRERIQAQHKYIGFMPDRRFETIKMLHSLLENKIKDKDTELLLNKINKIGESNLIIGIITIALLPQLSISQKISICGKSLMFGVLKALI